MPPPPTTTTTKQTLRAARAALLSFLQPITYPKKERVKKVSPPSSLTVRGDLLVFLL